MCPPVPRKMFGTLAEIDAKVLEIKEKLEELSRKHKQLYDFKTKGILKTNRQGQGKLKGNGYES